MCKRLEAKSASNACRIAWWSRRDCKEAVSKAVGSEGLEAGWSRRKSKSQVSMRSCPSRKMSRASELRSWRRQSISRRKNATACKSSSSWRKRAMLNVLLRWSRSCCSCDRNLKWSKKLKLWSQRMCLCILWAPIAPSNQSIFKTKQSRKFKHSPQCCGSCHQIQLCVQRWS